MLRSKDMIGFSSELQFAHLVDEGVIINKDGAFLTTYKYSGPDIESSTQHELDSLTENFNRAMTILDDGWMIHTNELRIPSIDYCGEGYFPDSVSKMIDEERRQKYKTEGLHFENLQFITFVWKFPLSFVKTSKSWFYSGLPAAEKGDDLNSLYKIYKDTIERCMNQLSIKLKLQKLNSADLLSYLNACITGDLVPVSVPPQGCYLDVALSRKPVIGGIYPKIGTKHVRVISLINYLNRQTIVGMLEEIGQYPLVYRWSNRFIPLSEETAEKEIKLYEKNWSNKAKGIMGIIKEVFTGQHVPNTNTNASDMCDEAAEALRDNSSKETRFGYWTSEIVIMHEDLDVISHATAVLKKYLEQAGFTTFIETINAMDAWIGSIPGHGSRNMRKLFVTSRNLAEAIPLQSIWTGNEFSHPTSLLPKNSPPLFYAGTAGNTPFRYHPDVEDVGHTLIAGPTGTGKTTLLGNMIAQFLRYENAKVKIFDKDFSHKALTDSLGGNHHNLGNANQLSFAPLSDLSNDSKKLRAANYIAMLVDIQGIKITPEIRTDIYAAIHSLSQGNNEESRNITVFRSIVQNVVVREALEYYTINGQLKVLDAVKNAYQNGHIETFETGWLLSQNKEISIPILKHIFDKIDEFLEESEGKYPTLIVLEEAWRYILSEYFSEKIEEWLMTLRKHNGRIIFTTPTLTALYDPIEKSLNKTSAIILESCSKKILLPNNQMDEDTRIIYQKMSLNERQVDIIANAVPKHDYYLTSHEGNRLFNLGFDNARPVALNFFGLSLDEGAELSKCKEKNGDMWVYHWLIQRGFDEWADYWKNLYNKTQGDAA